MSEPYPNRNGEQRKDDAHLLVRIAGDVAHWWTCRIGWISKTATILTFIGSLGGGIAVGLIAVGTLKANFADLPDRVEYLEDSFQAHVDTVMRPRILQIDDNTMRLDILRGDVTEIRDDIRGLREGVAGLRVLAEANNCWIRVAAGEESRFNCTGP